MENSDEFSDKINKEIHLRVTPNRAVDTGVAEWGMALHFSCVVKMKKVNKGKKVETIKRHSKMLLF